MASRRQYLPSIECSEQALDVAFHPKKENVLACGLVDGSLEIHDILIEEDLEDDDEPDSILASFDVHIKPPRHIQIKMDAVNDNDNKNKNNSDNSGGSNDDDDDSDSKAKKPSKQKKLNTKPSCRSVAFSPDGSTLFTGGFYGDLCAIDAERASIFSTSNSVDSCMLWRIDDSTGAKPSPIQSLQPFHKSPLLAVGDDNGGVRIWDLRLCSSSIPAAAAASATAGSSHRNKACVQSWSEHKDYISDFDLHPDEHTLLAASADGRLGAFDLRKQLPPNPKGKKKKNKNAPVTNFRLSDDQEDELLSIQIMKHTKKVVCGTAEGILAVWSYGTWGDISDRMPGHPSSIDALLKVDDDVLLTGSSDGLIRVVQIHPDKFLGVLGDGHGGFPIEKLDFNANRHMVASLSHSPIVKLWDARILGDDYDCDENGNDDSDDNNSDGSDNIGSAFASMTSKPAAAASASAAGANNSDDEWEDDDDDDDGDEKDSDDSDMDSSDDDEDGSGGGKNHRLKKRFKTESEKFFADM